MPRPLTDTDALLFGLNSETDEENGSNYDHLLIKKTQLLTMIQTQIYEGGKDSGLSVQRHRFLLISLGLKANAEMVPNFPSCHYKLLM
jgi:hypothetical protein